MIDPLKKKSQMLNHLFGVSVSIPKSKVNNKCDHRQL